MLFDEVLEERWSAGDLSASNRVLAERFLGVSEKTVRRWRQKEYAHQKPLPVAALLAFPAELTQALCQRMAIARGRRSNVVALRSAVDRVVGAPIDPSDREALMAIHHQLGAVLFGGSR